jgi:hypothetical protein
VTYVRDGIISKYKETLRIISDRRMDGGYYMYACSIFNNAILMTEDYIVSNEVVISE